jgi:hypothetical protein
MFTTRRGRRLSAQETNEFRVVFADFLLRHGDEWRLRRTDQFTPVDLNTARRTITIQGLISRDLLRHFAEELEDAGASNLLGRRSAPLPRPGDELFLFLPFAAYPKRVLLDFSTADSRGCAVPLVSRLPGSAVTGAHLLALLKDRSKPPRRQRFPTEQEEAGALIVCSAIAALSPAALQERLDRAPRGVSGQSWEQENIKLLTARWLQTEGNRFLPGLGDSIGPAIAGSRVVGVGPELRRFVPTGSYGRIRIRRLADLVLLGIGDVLKVIVSQAQPADQQLLLGSPALLAELVRDYVLPGLDYVLHLASHMPVAGQQALGRGVVDWNAYLATSIAVDRPFIFKADELIKVSHRRRSFHFWTTHSYPLTLTDSPATHVEVACGDLELEIPRRGAIKLRVGDAPAPTATVFGGEYRESRQVAHFYASRLGDEGLPRLATRSKPLSRLRRKKDENPGDERGALAHASTQLVVRFRLSHTLTVGYWVSLVAVVSAATWLSWEWVRPAWQHHMPPGHENTLLLVTAAFAAFPLWLTSSQHRTALVQQKLLFVRGAIAIALLIPLAAAAFAWAVRTGRFDLAPATPAGHSAVSGLADRTTPQRGALRSCRGGADRRQALAVYPVKHCRDRPDRL